jgi:glycosyltransferase involved in cell wall biosynthesis
MPKISVIIPTYNRADLLPRAIQSVINQTYKDWELLIIDDGSTDNTKEIVDEFIKKDNRIKYFYEENSGSASKPRNFGIQNSKGEYIAFLDSDNEWLPLNLEKHIDLHNKKPEIDLSGSNFNFNGTAWYAPECFAGKYDLFWTLRKCIDPSTMFFKASFIKSIGGFDESLKIGEDGDISIRSAISGKIYMINECLVNYYADDDNSLSRKKNFNIDPLSSFSKKHFSEYKNANLLGLYYYELGSTNCEIGIFKLGRKYLRESLKYSDSTLKYRISYFISLFGRRFWFLTHFIYRNFIKKRIK